MRIGIITHTYLPQIDGVVRSVQTISKYLQKEGHQVYIFAPEYKNIKNADTENVIRVESLLNPSFSGFEVPFPNLLTPKAIKKISDLELDIIHVQNPFLVGEVSLMLGKLLNIPVVFTYHTIYEQQAHYAEYFSNLISKLSLEWGSYFADRVNHVIAPSERIKNKLIKLGVEQKITVLPTGLDFELIKQAKKHKLNINKEDKVLISVGRLGFDKRVLMILDTLTTYLKKHSNVKYIICGDGPEKPRIENLIKREGLEKQVMLTGSIDYQDIFSYLKCADLFLIASKDETQGMSVIEALACKVPVVAINEEWVENWQTKAVIKTEKDNLEKTIESLLEKDLAEIKNAGYLYAKQFSEEKLVKKLIEVYQNAIKESEEKSIRKGVTKKVNLAKDKLRKALK